MSILDDFDKNEFARDVTALTAAIRQIYKEADIKRKELLSTVDEDLRQYAPPPYNNEDGIDIGNGNIYHPYYTPWSTGLDDILI